MANMQIQVINGRVRGALGIYSATQRTSQFTGSVLDCAAELKIDSEGVAEYVRIRIKDRELALSNVAGSNLVAVDAVNGVAPTSIAHLYELIDAALCAANTVNTGVMPAIIAF